MISHCIRDQRGIFEKIDELVDHVNELEKEEKMSKKVPMVTIYKNGKRFETYTDGTTIVEDMATGKILEEF